MMPMWERTEGMARVPAPITARAPSVDSQRRLVGMGMRTRVEQIDYAAQGRGLATVAAILAASSARPAERGQPRK